MREKGFAPIIILLLITALIVGYLIYSGKINLNKSQSPTSKSTESSPSAITSDQNQATNSSAPTSEEIQGFPVYPGAKFVEKIKSPSCNGTTVDYTCSSIVYSWTSDQADKIYDYYQNDPDHTGWKMSGGGGEFTDKQNYRINSRLTVGDKFYPFVLTAGNNYVQFNLTIPNK